jgi:transcriptional regulator with XRE-family HTH domain
MAKPQPSDEFKRTFTAGIRAARVNKGLTQIQMAKLLGIPQDHYKQYEGRTLMPHLLLAAFCHETQLNASQLLAEAGAAAARAQRRVA